MMQPIRAQKNKVAVEQSIRRNKHDAEIIAG